jgi:hypothetical protein
MGEKVVVGRGALATEVRPIEGLVEVTLYRRFEQQGAKKHEEELIRTPLRV